MICPFKVNIEKMKTLKGAYHNVPGFCFYFLVNLPLSVKEFRKLREQQLM